MDLTDALTSPLGIAALVLLSAAAALLLRLLRGAGGPRDGDIWWAQVPFEDGTGSKDRPCLVVGRQSGRVVVMPITSKDKAGRRGYVPVPRHGWARGGGVSWLRTDRTVALPRQAFRRRAGAAPHDVRRLLA